MRKRLQVFVSSTYTDMLPERQAAVESILKAGHIPAGMELFTAGDQTQLQVVNSKPKFQVEATVTEIKLSGRSLRIAWISVGWAFRLLGEWQHAFRQVVRPTRSLVSANSRRPRTASASVL